MTVHLSAAAANALAQVIADLINGGAGAGYIEIYGDTIPATVATAITTQTLLGTLTFSNPCESGAPVAGLLTFSAITQDPSANATDIATWARIYDSAATAIIDVNVGASGSGAPIELNTTSIVAGGPIVVNSATWQQPMSG